MLKVYQSLLDAPLALTDEAKLVVYPIIAKMLSGELVGDTNEDHGSDPNKIEGSLYVTEEMQTYYYGSDNFNVDGVAVYNVDGIINSRNSYWDVSSTRALKRVAFENENNENVLAHVFHVRSGGGDATELKQTVDFLDKTLKKPRLTIITGSGGSMGFGLFCWTDKVYASTETDRVGSIGIVATLRDDTEMQKRMGIKLIEIKGEQAENKNAEAISAINGDIKPYQDAFVSPVNEAFINLIKKYRPATIGHPIVFTGQTFLAKDGLGNGLLDGIKSYEDVIAEAFVKGKAYKAKQQTKTNVISPSQINPSMKIFGIEFNPTKTETGVTISGEPWAQIEAKLNEQNKAEAEASLEAKMEEKLAAIEQKYAATLDAAQKEIADLKAWQTGNPATAPAAVNNPPVAETTETPKSPWEEFNATVAKDFITGGLL
jgi:ClpP class serine protease